MIEKMERLEEMLLELKNVSELMIDLAYSALIFNSKEMAEEVQRLEDYVDELHMKFELSAMSTARLAKRSEEFLSLIRLGIASERIADAALQVAQTVLRGLEPHPILLTLMEEAEETITKVEISEDSILAKKTIEELGLPGKIGQRIIAIQRKGKWIYRPGRKMVIEPGDVVLARGYAAGKERLEALASAQLKEL